MGREKKPIRLELIIDGIVHYNEVHQKSVIELKKEYLKRYLVLVGYKESYQMYTYIKSKYIFNGVRALSYSEIVTAVGLLSLYSARGVAKRYNVNKTTILKYKKLIEDDMF